MKQGPRELAPPSRLAGPPGPRASRVAAVRSAGRLSAGRGGRGCWVTGGARSLPCPPLLVADPSCAPSPACLSCRRYLALYAYKPQKSDELELRKGDTYRVLEKCRDGWFKGTALRTGLSGVFPGNYVTPVSR